jgi:hypothetical protein
MSARPDLCGGHHASDVPTAINSYQRRHRILHGLMQQLIHDYAASPDCRRHRWAGCVEYIPYATLLWFGVAGVLVIGKNDLMYVFWPSSVMLLTGWRSTILGMMITVSSAVINCLLYMAFAYALLGVARLVRT